MLELIEDEVTDYQEKWRWRRWKISRKLPCVLLWIFLFNENFLTDNKRECGSEIISAEAR